MDFIAGGIVKHRKLIVIIFLAATVVCAGLYLGVTVNYNLTDYLPEDAPSTKALDVMKKEFGADVTNARVMLKDVSVNEALAYKEKLAAIEGVSGLLWLDDIIDVKTPLETADPATVEKYYKDGNALISFVIADGDEVRITDEIYDLIGEDNPLSGEANDRAWMKKLTSSEVANAMKILVPIIVLILILSTEFWLEPLLFLLAIGVSVVINMGTNIIFGEVSFVANSVTPILQLAVSMDYAIFLLHRFADYRGQGHAPEYAMQLAIKRAFSTITASASTTVFGFLALVFMDFRLGADLGLSLLKGIVFSFVSVVCFLPAFTICVYRTVDRTKHRHLLPDAWPRLGRAVAKIGIPILIVVIIAAVPSFFAQNKNDFTYGYGSLNLTGSSGLDTAEINESFGKENAAVILVPSGNPVKEKELANALSALPHVKEVVSYATAVGEKLPEEYLDKNITKQFYSENYARLIAYTTTADEGEEAFALVDKMRNVTAEYYGDSYYALGQSVNLADMEEVVTKDQQKVLAIAIISIFLILLINFRSLVLPFILLLTIEFAIWINLAIPYFADNSLSYIGYLVLSTVQLGATVDYAILLTDHHMELRKTLPSREACKAALSETFGSILVSGAILSAAGFTLWISSSNPMVAEIGLLLGRGTLLSVLMVVFFLPTLLRIFDGAIIRTTMKAKSSFLPVSKIPKGDGE